MSIENKVPMSDFTEVTDIADTARIIGLQDNENVRIPLQSLIAKTLTRVDEDILTLEDINIEGGVTGFNPIGQVAEGDKRAVSGDEVYEAIDSVNVLDITRNLVNTKDVDYLQNKILQSTGVIVDNAGGYVTGFIKIKPNTYYTPSIKRNVNYYDANFVRLGNISDARADLFFKTPSNAVYIRFSGYSDNLRLIEGQYSSFPDSEVPNNDFYAKLKTIQGAEIEVSNLSEKAFYEINSKFLIDVKANSSILDGDLSKSSVRFTYGKLDNANDFIKNNYHLNQAVYPQYNATNGADVDVVRLLFAPKVNLTLGKYVKFSFYVLSKNENIAPYTSLLRIDSSSEPTQAVILRSSEKIDDNTWLRLYETNVILNDTYSGLSDVLIYHYIRSFTGYSDGSYIFFGFSAYESESSTFENETLLPSWEFVIKEEIRKLKDNTQDTSEELNTPWNNVGYNRAYVSSFLRKKQRKEVDEFNELNVTLMGTSSFGREYSEDTQNVNDYPISPLFPRYGMNEEYENITFYLRQILKYDNEDVVFSPAVQNLSELTKSGSFTEIENNDFVKLLRSTTSGNSINIDVSNYNFVKVYFLGTANIFIDNVLIESVVSLDEGKSSNKRYNVVGKGNLRIESVGTSGLNIWGFERWNNPKVCVLNNAVGGTTSSAFISNWAKWSKGLDLATYQIPGGNDTSTTNSGFFKGKKEPNSAGITTGLNFFIYANTTGTYVNYGNLYLNKGEYAEWNGTVWVKGSTRVNQDLDNWYNNMKTLLYNVLPTGCPHIGIIQHKVNWIDDRPWQWDIIKMSRSMWQEKGMALIDVFYKSEQKSSFLADGTHYKHNMALSYAEEYARIFNYNLDPYYTESYQPYITRSLMSDVIEANSSYKPRVLSGSSSSNSVTFNIPFNQLPKVRVYNNNSIVVTDITKNGFTITGSGNYEWEACIL